jgi:hypothetical protein
MTPEELCKYIIEGKIFDDVQSGDSDYAEEGRDIWPKRYDILLELAKEALNANKPATDRNGVCRPYLPSEG